MARSVKKGPYVSPKLLKKIRAMNEARDKKMIRTWSRRFNDHSGFVGHTIAVQ